MSPDQVNSLAVTEAQAVFVAAAERLIDARKRDLVEQGEAAGVAEYRAEGLAQTTLGALTARRHDQRMRRR